MKYTDDKPTKVGFYWIKKPLGVLLVVEVTRFGGRLWAESDWLDDVRNDLKWAGPIEEVKERP